jgi:hypothetical protein
MTESDQERWLTYVELGRLLGVSSTAARMHAKRRGWPRRSPNMIGDHARVLVPDDAVVQRRAANDQRVFVAQMYDGANSGAEPDQAERAAICSAITALSEALGAERERVIRAEQQIEQLRTELADTRGAERISSDAAAALRHQLDLLLARRPWRRRWLR